MKAIPVLATLAVVLAVAAPVLGHEFSSEKSTTASNYTNGGKVASMGLNHLCTGTPDWQAAGGVSKIGTHLNAQDLFLYLHQPPHEGGDEQDPELVGGMRLPGILWLETNDLDGLQKNDWLCHATDGAHDDDQVHGDMVIL